MVVTYPSFQTSPSEGLSQHGITFGRVGPRPLYGDFRQREATIDVGLRLGSPCTIKKKTERAKRSPVKDWNEDRLKTCRNV